MPETDPCEVLAQLEARRLDILMNGSVKVTRFRAATGQEEEVQLAAPDLKALDAEIARYRDRCDASNGKRRRFAIRAG